VPVSPPSDVPPGLRVTTTSSGRLLVTDREFSVYSADQDPDDASACDAACTQRWPPVTAPASATPHGDWSVIVRHDGIRQWALHRRALYRSALDTRPRSLKGNDIAGWHNVYMRRAPAPPPEFTVQDTTAGQVLADARGRTIYVYACGDDAEDQLSCDHPTTPQAYRFAMCGGGDPDRCVRNFPYVLASQAARPSGRTWRPVDIDPRTGRFAKPGESGSVHVWAYRDRPIYTYAGDRQPGDINADAHGEFRGERNGFKAFWIRDDFYDFAG
jgi:predicted lipoprotein with Yx(FWY)xxD motif